MISIVMLLVSILLPALSKAKARGQQISCSSRLKQIGTASLAYTTDYDGWWPIQSTTSETGDWPNCQIRWFPKLGSYMGIELSNDSTIRSRLEKLQKLFLCPAKASGYSTDWWKICYSYNYYFIYYGTGETGNQYNRICNLKRGQIKPSQTMYVMDGHVSGNDYTITSFITAENRDKICYHAGSANILFFDLHTTGLSFLQIPTGTSTAFWTSY